MKKYKIIIFDLDDTLIDNLENIKYAFKCMIESLNINYNDDLFNRWYLFDKSFWKDWDDKKIIIPNEYKGPIPKMVEWVQSQRPLLFLKEELNINIDLQKAIDLNNYYMEKLKDVVLPIKGAEETLKYLYSQGYVIVVATNGAKPAVSEKLKKINCLEYINNILTATDIGERKPSPVFFEGITKLMGNNNLSDYLMIGNSYREDVLGAQNAGIDACLLNIGDEKFVDNQKPVYTINELIELKNIL